MIRSFDDGETAKVWRFERSRELPPDIQNVARRKLAQLDAVEQLQELRFPGANRFEKLKGYTPSRYSIRINDQWRVCFNGSDGGADNVRIEDYHRG